MRKGCLAGGSRGADLDVVGSAIEPAGRLDRDQERPRGKREAARGRLPVAIKGRDFAWVKARIVGGSGGVHDRPVAARDADETVACLRGVQALDFRSQRAFGVRLRCGRRGSRRSGARAAPGCRARSPAGTVAGSRKVRSASSTNTTVSTPAYQATRRKLSERRVHGVHALAQPVAHAAHGADELHRVRVVHLRAQVAHVDIDDVGQPLEALVPHVLDDHRAREHAPGIGRQVLQQRVLLGGELDAPAGASHLLREPVDLEVRHPQHA